MGESEGDERGCVALVTRHIPCWFRSFAAVRVGPAAAAAGADGQLERLGIVGVLVPVTDVIVDRIG